MQQEGLADWKSMTEKNLTEHAQRFIKAHRASSTNREVAEKMQMSVASAASYAKWLRERGVKLERFAPGRPKIHTQP